MRRLAARLLLVLFGLAAGVALAEIGLRAAARFAPAPRGGSTGETTVLCVGDSHTYGLHVAWPQTYPARLQALLDPAAERVGVLNYGVPGRNCARLRRELPRYLAGVRPDVVLVLVGFNDTWNRDATEASAEEGWWARLASRSRLLRFLRLARLRAEDHPEGPPPDPIEVGERTFVREDGATVAGALPRLRPLESEELAAVLAPCLEDIVRLVRVAGAVPVLLTYAPGDREPFQTVNRVVREVARREGVRLVALDEIFSRAPAESPLLFPDLHPTPSGNDLIANAVAERLRAWGLVPAAPPVSRPAALSGRVELRCLAESDGRVVAEVRGPPGRPFQVVLSEATDPPIRLFGVEVPLAAGPTLGRSLESLSLRGTLDADGTARAPFEPDRLSASPGGPLYACALVFPPAPAPDAPPLVSAAVAVPRTER